MTDLDTQNIVVWPRWCYSSAHMDSEAQDLVLNNNSSSYNNNISISLKEKNNTEQISIKGRRKLRRELHNGLSRERVSNGMPNDAPSGDVKAERVSPNLSSPVAATQPPSQISPSTSPKSPTSLSTRTPSFSGTPPNPTFTPPSATIHSPYDRFSPAALGTMGGLHGGHGTLKQMETLMTRNCSDLMRSLAAKYNNSAPNDFFSSPSHTFLRAPLNNINPFKQSNAQFIGSTPPHTVTTSSRDMDKKTDLQVSIAASGFPTGLPHSGASQLFGGPGIPAFPGFPLVDMSSTQVLLNMVRNASAAQQSQLENYLRGAMKRPAEGPASPLDLSASMGAKRPRTDLGKAFDVKSLFSLPSDEDRKLESKLYPPISPTPIKIKPPPSPTGTKNCISSHLCSDQNCQSLESISQWTIEDVCSFVRSIDLCAEYSEAFREQRIDGSALPLLTEDHLTSSIGMKLGPALKLRSALAKKIGACNICLHCNHCHAPPNERRPSSASLSQ